MAEVLRSCKVCRSQHPKSQLTRWVQDASGTWQEDATKTMPGRGTYTDSPECSQKLAKIKVKR